MTLKDDKKLKIALSICLVSDAFHCCCISVVQFRSEMKPVILVDTVG